MYATYGATVEGLRDRGIRLRDICAMVRHLPETAPVWTAANPARQFTQTHYMLADLVDAVRENTFVLASAHSSKAGRIKPPDPYPRPARAKPRLNGEQLVRPTQSFDTPADFDAWRAARLAP